MSAWKAILTSNLSSEDISYFHSIILSKRIFDKIPFNEKVFENFYPEVDKVDKESASQSQIYNTSSSFVYDSELCDVDVSLLVSDDSVDPWKIKGTVNWETGLISEDL